MFTSLVCLWTIFCRRLARKKSRYNVPSHITLKKSMPTEKRSHLKGTISIGHCRRHNCVILISCFEGFYDNQRR